MSLFFWKASIGLSRTFLSLPLPPKLYGPLFPVCDSGVELSAGRITDASSADFFGGDKCPAYLGGHPMGQVSGVGVPNNFLGGG